MIKKNDKDNDKDNWVLCDLCNIWRLLPDTYDMKALLKKGNIWICNVILNKKNMFKKFLIILNFN
jgi:hypothetical protein